MQPRDQMSDAAPASRAAGPSVGEIFAGRYRVERLLGRGAMGEVWAAHDEEVGDQVALKLLLEGGGFGDVEEAAERFRREVRLARRVTHRNAARIFDLGSHQGVLYLTMELVAGDSLEGLLRDRGSLAPDEASEIARQIALGLDAVHQMGVVHRDLKPANVLIDGDGRVVLTDFGLARASSGDAKLTRGQLFAGTPAYMAPEQVRGSESGPATDLYALGAVLFEELTGRPPFVRDSAVATAMARLEEDAPDPRQLVSVGVSLPEGLVRLVRRCLERQPERRPASAAEVAAELAKFARSLEVQASPGGAVDSARTLLAPGAASEVRSFVVPSAAECSLAVLPFRHRGAEADAGITDGIVEELVDALTLTRGLRVTATGATERYRGTGADPREVGSALAVDAIVDGTVQTAGDRLRASARLIDVATGGQLWVGRFDGALEDPFEIQTTIAQRITEQLRVQLELLIGRQGIPQEAVDLYRQALSRLEVSDFTGDNVTAALELLETSLQIAPGFALAVAAYAEAAIRRWVAPGGIVFTEAASHAHRASQRALEQASHLPLTHYAAGRLAVSDGAFELAARELTAAISMAPTYATVHDYLGSLQCEAGRGDEGARHIELASKIDPSILSGHYTLARRYALARDLDRFDRTLAWLRSQPPASRFMIESLDMRVGGWFGDLDRVRRSNPSVFTPAGNVSEFMDRMRQGLLGECGVEEILEILNRVHEAMPGPRLEVFTRQLALEVLVPLGARDEALRELRLAARSDVFVDTDWLELCPALDPLRADHDLSTLVTDVRRRANAIWRTL